MRSTAFSAALAAVLMTTAPTLADSKSRSDTASVKSMSAPKDDATFAMHMAHHHREGIALADAVIANGSSADVKQMAQRIRADQAKELAMLDRTLKADKKAGTKVSHPPKDPDMDRGMAQLKAAKGADADALFLQLMIKHHASALMMSHDALPSLQDTELRRMAQDGFSKQAREIGELERLRESNRSARK